ncbi:MAG TPA: hypothetical protein DCL44_04250 [Elusimicrobia bacterium]|nr:hypothetical protein [Elusimicrobiota bacterium]
MNGLKKIFKSVSCPALFPTPYSLFPGCLDTVRSVAAETFRESVKNRFFTIFAVFAACAIYASLLVGVMAVDEEARVLSDLGLGLMELMTLAYALFHAAMAIPREVETKTIYLVFSRPVSRPAYLLGKASGLYLLSAFMLSVMAAIHLSLMALRGFPPGLVYFHILACIWLKVIIITSLALFISLFSTSPVSTMVISGIIWTLGHFTPEARFLVEKTAGFSGRLLKGAAWLIPDLQLYNLRDAPLAAAPGVWFQFAYAALWALGSYGAAVLLFKKKEF